MFSALSSSRLWRAASTSISSRSGAIFSRRLPRAGRGAVTWGAGLALGSAFALGAALLALAAGFAASDDLVTELQQHVRGLLAPYEYPKEIEFIDALPMTTTGKVQRRVLRLQEEARARSSQPRVDHL